MMNSTEHYSWMNPQLELKAIPEYGNGVFAKESIKRGEILAIFGGRIINEKDEYIDTGIQISDDLVITSLDNNEPANFFNHSCNPNSGIKGQIFLISMKEINRNEQVTFDYAMCLYSKDPTSFYSFKCMCGTSDCRGKVTSNDWKIKKLQEKYAGYFQYFLQEKIDNSKL